MISYSLNTKIRKRFMEFFILISICITVLIEHVLKPYFTCIEKQSEFLDFILSLNAFKLLVEVTIPPFFCWWLIDLLYSKYLWKLPVFQVFHLIPDLNGKWKGYTMNDEKQEPRKVLVVIKQDWYTIRIQTEMIDLNKKSDIQSFCECTVAAIDLDRGKLKYAYKNTLLGENSYVGYNELRIDENKISGQYITTKPTKGVFEIQRDE